MLWSNGTTGRVKAVSYESKNLSRWLRGRLDYKLHAGQRLIRGKYRGNPTQLFVGECARQFGKSFLLVTEAIEAAIKTPKGRIKYGTAFQTDLLEFILPTFETVLADCPTQLRPVFKVQGSKWIFPNGAEIKLVGLDRKPNGLRGNVIDMIILDEAGFMSRLDYLYKSVIIPATTHRPDCKILVFSTPPSTPAHEFLDYVQKAELEGGYAKFTIYDNPMVGSTDIERLMKESGGVESTTWRREYLCEHITDANLAVVGEWRDEFAKCEVRDPCYSLYHRYVAMDLGVRDNTACLFGYYDFKQARLVIEDELVMNGSELTTEVISRKIQAKEMEVWPDNRKPYIRVADNNNPLLLQDLSFIHGLHFTATDKGRLDEMVNTVKILVRDGGLTVQPNCKHLLGCLKYGVWDKHRDKFAQSNTYGHFDGLAALIYLVRNLDRVTNPIPQGFMVDTTDNIIFQRDTGSSAVNTLKTAFGLKRTS